MKRSDFRNKIIGSYSPKFERKIRTAGGISRDTGLPIEDVIEYLEDHPERFRILPLRPAGSKLYELIED